MVQMVKCSVHTAMIITYYNLATQHENEKNASTHVRPLQML